MKFSRSNGVALTATVFFLTMFFFSCKKESADNDATALSESDAVEYSAESMEAEASFDDIYDIGMSAADEEGIISAGKGQGAKPFPFLRLRLRIGAKATITVTPDDNTYPKTVTIDFGNGENCPDGKFRQGKIVLHFTAPVRRPGAVVTITLVDFKLGRASIEGTKVITNLSENGNINFSVKVTGGKVTYPNGRGYTYEKLKNVNQIAGGATDEISDDVYSIAGESKATFKNGIVIAFKTTEDLVKKVSCAWISEGVLQVKVRNHEFSLDYGYPGNGECDNKALLKWKSKEKIILLP
jgi:hypothetical protein